MQPPAKTARRAKSVCSLGAEQVVAPVDRRAQRLLAGRQVARPGAEEVEALLEPGEQRLGREQLRASGRELDRERQAVEADADLGDAPARSRLVTAKSAFTARARSMNSATASYCESDVISGRRAGSGRSSGGTGYSCSPERRTGHAAGHEELQLRRGREQVGERGRGLDEVLDVVEHEQQPLLGEEVREALGRRKPRRSP